MGRSVDHTPFYGQLEIHIELPELQESSQAELFASSAGSLSLVQFFPHFFSPWGRELSLHRRAARKGRTRCSLSMS